MEMRMGKRIGMAAVLVIAMASCASVRAPLAPDAYQLDIRDNPAERRFDVVLQSRHDRALCVSSDSWPLSPGTLRAENTGVYLETAAGILPLQGQFVSVYCPGGCGEVRVEPGATLSGFFAYSAFGDADRIAADASRQLHYALAPQACRRPAR
jgi:hypothetical protein